MWTSLTAAALALSFSSVTSSNILPRQEQCLSASSNAAYAACAMRAAFGGSSIPPELLANIAPQAALAVEYGDVVIGGAQQLSPSKVFAQPSLAMAFVSNKSQPLESAYVVVGLTYQPPSASKLFWLQSGFKVDNATGALSSSSAATIKYTSPNPAKGTGANEYIFIIFREAGFEALIKQNPLLATLNTTAFDVRALKLNSTISEHVIAASYFKSTFDGIAIDGQTPVALAATQLRQVSSTPNVTAVPANSTAPTPAAVAVKAANTTAAPVQTVQAVNTTSNTSSQTLYSSKMSDNDSASSAETLTPEDSFKSLIAIALFSTYFL